MQISNLTIQKHKQHILSDNDLITKNNSPALTEALKSARTNLMYALSDVEGCKCLLVTSALPAEGKSTTCVNLAVSLAQTEAKVLLIDADLRRPRTHTYLDIKNRNGLSNYLGGFCEFDEMVQHLENLNLDCITAGNPPPNPSELLASKKMQAFMERVKENYDYVIFDTPPVNVVTDAQALTQLAENVVLVCKCGTSLTAEVQKALSSLTFAHAKILGFITIDAANRNKRKSKDYAGYYHYGDL